MLRHFGLNPSGRVIDRESLYLDTSATECFLLLFPRPHSTSRKEKEIDDINSPAAW